MNDCRYHEVLRKPTKRDMTKIEKELERILASFGILAKGRRR